MPFQMRIWALVVMLLVAGGGVFLFSGFDVLGGYHPTVTIVNNKNLDDKTTGGLVAHWTFDGKDMTSNVADISGNANNGDLLNQVATTTAAGKIGQGINFDGVDDVIDVPHAASLGTPPLTIAFWQKTDVTADDKGETEYYVLKRAVGTSTKAWSFFTESGTTNNGVRFGVSDTVGVNTTIDANDDLVTGRWYFVVGTIDASYNTKLYIDGVQQTETGSPGSILSNDDVLRMGGNADNSQRLDGTLDDVRVYSRVLTDAEIVRLYKLGAGAAANKTLINNKNLDDKTTGGLIAHWTFDGKDSINNFGDISGNANNGTTSSTSTTPGRIGQAFLFNAGTHQVDVAASNSVANVFGGTNGGTIVAWIYPKSYGGASIGRIFDKGGDAGYNLSVHNAVDTVPQSSLYFKKGAATTIGEWATATGTIGIKQWYHVAISYSTSSNANVPTLYINGLPSSTVTVTVPVGTLSSDTLRDIHIGNRADLIRGFNGVVDDVRMYDHILSDAEIMRLYRMGSTGPINTTLKNNLNLNNGLIGHWTMDGQDMVSNVADVSGNGNNGRVLNQAATTTVAGRIGQGLKFDGVNDTVDVPNVTAFDQVPFTTAFWISVNEKASVVGSDFYVLLKRHSASPNQSWYIRIGSADDLIRFVTRQTDGVTVNTTVANAANAFTTLRQWHHVVATIDASYQQYLYFDGVQQTDNDAAVSLFDSDDVLRMGANTASSLQSQVNMDDVRFYNRVLTAAEIKRLYQLGN